MEKTIDQLVEERVQARLKEIEAGNRVDAWVAEKQAKQNQHLRQMASQAQREPDGAYGSGRQFAHAGEISQGAASRIAAQWTASIAKGLKGTKYELAEE